jgi:hypothetical protein
MGLKLSLELIETKSGSMLLRSHQSWKTESQLQNTEVQGLVQVRIPQEWGQGKREEPRQSQI